MKTNLKTLVAAAALIAGIGAASAVYAHEDEKSSGSMMGQGGMMQGNPGNMTGMMNMMGQMSTMMESCNKMMQGMTKKHEQSPEADPEQQE